MVTETVKKINNLVSVEALLAQALGIKEVGEHIGIPIIIRPWWGSRRRLFERKHKKCGHSIFSNWCFKCEYRVAESEIVSTRSKHPEWVCPGGSTFNEIKWPLVVKDSVVLWEGACGTGHRRGRHHRHAQELQVLDFTDQAMLLRVTVGTQHKLSFLIGRDDGKPFVHPVTKGQTTVATAYNYIVPKPVFEAQMHGFKVIRQGDWYFVPREFFNTYPLKEVKAMPWPKNPYRGTCFRDTGTIYINAVLEGTRHRAERLRTQYPHFMVKGVITAPDHPDVRLETWHTAIRNIRSAAVNRDNGGYLD